MPHSTANQKQLPQPSGEDIAISDQLKELMIEKIKQEGDMPFSEYMNMALYENGLGYYVSGLRKFGEQGDFITSPEVSVLFGQTLANQIIEVFSSSDIDCVFELGAGTGKLVVDVLNELEQQDQLPNKYYILDISGEMQQRQREHIADILPHLLNRVEWLNQWPEKTNAVVIANEVLDAMPIERFLYHEDKVLQQYVSVEGNELVLKHKESDKHFTKNVLAKLNHQHQPYMSEFNTSYSAWFSSLFGAIEKGVLFFVDYGYPRKEYYMEERQQGTLMCFYRHHAHSDVLLNPGLQDITAFVDFTEVVETATDAGFSFEGFVAQGDFLLSNQITEKLDRLVEGTNEAEAFAYSKQLKQLTLPGEMGERFKVIGFSKNYQPEISGFNKNDQSYRL